MPGLGDPMRDIDIDDFCRYAEQVGFIQKLASQSLTDRDLVEMEAGIG